MAAIGQTILRGDNEINMSSPQIRGFLKAEPKALGVKHTVIISMMCGVFWDSCH